MGKKIRGKERQKEELIEAQMAALRNRPDSKKRNKKESAISLPAICGKYFFQGPIETFKCSSYSPFRRLTQLLKHLYCLYPVPGWLIDWLAFESEFEIENAAHERSVALLMSIIFEIGCGRSPRHILKPYLSKAENAAFFKSGAPKDKRITIFAHFIYCKALAKGLAQSVGLKLAQVASDQRLDKPEIFTFMENFIEFCASREVNALSVQDIWDYLRCNNLVGAFSFKGRTLASALNLVNAWHENLIREARALGQQRIDNNWAARQALIANMNIKYSAIRGIPPAWKLHDKLREVEVEMRQIGNYTDLVNEGRAMRHCVASYHSLCERDICAIFSLRINGERTGTIEVRGKNVVQARGPCNRELDKYSLKCLRNWMVKFKVGGEV